MREQVLFYNLTLRHLSEFLPSEHSCSICIQLGRQCSSPVPQLSTRVLILIASL